MPTGLPIPKPFNENDVTIWSDLICKFVCLRKKMPFDLVSFLDDIVNDRIMPLNAYNREMFIPPSRDNQRKLVWRLYLRYGNYRSDSISLGSEQWEMLRCLLSPLCIFYTSKRSF
ncbi:MAG: hypothetical protein ACRD8W_02315 [Nitrososphaeraceae archaeon]